MSNPNKIKEIPTLETERLILRGFTEEDIYDVYEYASIPEVTEFLPWDAHKSINDTKEFLQQSKKLFVEKDNFDFGIVLKTEQKLIGGISIRNWNDKNMCADIGFVLSPKYWNSGIMTEAIRRIIKYGFDELKVNRIEAHCDVENIGSYKAMEKSGMQCEGVLRKKIFLKNRFWSMKFYSILKDEFYK